MYVLLNITAPGLCVLDGDSGKFQTTDKQGVIDQAIYLASHFPYEDYVVVEFGDGEIKQYPVEQTKVYKVKGLVQ
jgi:hypothetical protein